MTSQANIDAQRLPEYFRKQLSDSFIGVWKEGMEYMNWKVWDALVDEEGTCMLSIQLGWYQNESNQFLTKEQAKGNSASFYNSLTAKVVYTLAQLGDNVVRALYERQVDLTKWRNEMAVVQQQVISEYKAGTLQLKVDPSTYNVQKWYPNTFQKNVLTGEVDSINLNVWLIPGDDGIRFSVVDNDYTGGLKMNNFTLGKAVWCGKGFGQPYDAPGELPEKDEVAFDANDVGGISAPIVGNAKTHAFGKPSDTTKTKTPAKKFGA